MFFLSILETPKIDVITESIVANFKDVDLVAMHVRQL